MSVFRGWDEKGREKALIWDRGPIEAREVSFEWVRKRGSTRPFSVNPRV
jgi:hypothetical protein